jgi:hypothetical protein
VADCYANTDGWSAASLNAVQFAYADPSAKRPSGLPPGLGMTWSDSYYQALAQAQADAEKGGGDDKLHDWKQSGYWTDADGTVHMEYKDQYGNAKTMLVAHNGNTTTTTTITPQGTSVSAVTVSSYPYGTVKTTTTTGPDGKKSTSTVETYSNGNTSVTSNIDGTGRTTSSTTVTYNADGGQTVTQRSYDDKGKPTVTDEVTYGKEALGVGHNVDSPAQQAIDDTKANLPPDDTRILAPEAPNTGLDGSGNPQSGQGQGTLA